MKKYKKQISILLVLCMVICFCSCTAQKENDLKEYRLRAYWFIGQENYEDIFTYVTSDDEEQLSIDKKYGADIYEEGDSLVITADEEQKNALIEKNRSLIEQASEEFRAGEPLCRTEYEEDYSQITFFINAEESREDIFKRLGHAFSIMCMVMTNRVLVTGDSDTCIKVTVKNAESGYTAAKSLWPYEQLNITDNDLEESHNHDVKISSKLKDYNILKATVVEKTDDKIILEPDNGSEMYADDSKLAICLDSVYAEDLTFPHEINIGDRFVLYTDGKYALHDDGDDIPDISAAAVIPDRYFTDM